MYATFSVKTEDLQKELDAQVKVVRKQIPQALQIVGAEMRDNLLTHLSMDWYSAYKPLAYMRRTDNPDLGTAITDTSVMNIDVKGANLTFGYMPTGETTQSFSFAMRNGDDLIEWIQSEHTFSHKKKRKRGRPRKDAPKDEYEDITIPARPFWNRFVNDQQSKAADAFFAAMASPTGEYEIVREATDTLDFSEYVLAEGSTDRLKTGGANTNKEYYTEEYDDEDDDSNPPY